jgi:hypothetical protein
VETKNNQRGSGKERESERTKRCAHSSKKELKVDAEAKRKQERGIQRKRLRYKEAKKRRVTANSQTAKTCNQSTHKPVLNVS